MGFHDIDPKHNKDMSTTQQIVEALRLLLLLIWEVIKYCFRKIVKGIAYVIYYAIRGVEWLVDFWNSNDTQQKKKKVIEATKRGAIQLREWTVIAAQFAWRWTKIGTRKLCEWSVIAFHATVKGIIWFAHAVVEFIIHMKPTIIKMGKATKAGAIAFWQWLKRMHKASQIRAVNRRRALIHFKHNGGVTGMLHRAGNNVKGSINSYMDEEQNEVSSELVSDELFDEEINENDGKAHIFGKKFYKRIKDIVEER